MTKNQTEPKYSLEARGITKRYGGVEALRGVDVKFRAGQVTALIGDNGAGKSTLVKILSGAASADEGEILLDGSPVSFSSPMDAHHNGVETVYQDLSLAPDLDPTDNLFLGREILKSGVAGWFGFLDKRAMRTASAAEFTSLGLTMQDSRVPIASLSGGQRQSIAVGRAATWVNKVLFLDEPTAALGVVQTRMVLDLILRIKERGIAVVLVSHNMPDVLEVADQIEVLRLGRRIASFERAEVNVDTLVGAMTGSMTPLGEDS